LLGIGQSEFLWYIRGKVNIIKIYANLWKSEELLTSFDGCGAFRPPEVDIKYRTIGGWYHVDQNGYLKKGKNCVQGLLNLLPSNTYDGGIVVLPKTHQIFNEKFFINIKIFVIIKTMHTWIEI